VAASDERYDVIGSVCSPKLFKKQSVMKKYSMGKSTNVVKEHFSDLQGFNLLINCKLISDLFLVESVLSKA
jgi:hypothetical protein